tara:strand:+ start:787 stop:1701 length:915 start_codon:yes stop_codon:yes gene_type:complete
VKSSAVLDDYWQNWRQRVDKYLDQYLPIAKNDQEPKNLYRAIRYVALGNGKRFRAALVYATGDALGSNLEKLDIPACAVELIHAFSLVHDDLPSMDDDELRRGKPSCHIAFDEATAILTGDALQSLAFELLASISNLYSPESQIKMVDILSKATGPFGMAGGQAIDLNSIVSTCAESDLNTMHRLKTGALIAASVQLGALAANVHHPHTLALLKDFGMILGLAFQITDDILDGTSESQTLGKTAGSDLRNEKPTFLTVLGESEARNIAVEYGNLALAKLAELSKHPMDTTNLLELTKFVTNRDS